MTYPSIQIGNLELSLPHKLCFTGFSTTVPYGSRIAVIGRNGSGKSTLLKIIAGMREPSDGQVIRPQPLRCAYVPQIVEDYVDLSGGERFNAALTDVLYGDPDVLLLDEPTNHLDEANRKSLMHMLQSFQGTLIIASHDTQLLRECVDTLWHINDGRIHEFCGNYDDYIREIKLKRASIESELHMLSRQKKQTHDKLMQEQQRAAKSKASGDKKVADRKWLKMTGDLKGMKAEKSQGKKLRHIEDTKQELHEELTRLRLPEVIVPKFSISTGDIRDRPLVQISHGSVGYDPARPLICDICFNIGGRDRVAVLGGNGTGKSTFIKALLGDKSIHKTGEWHVIKSSEIGYLDQHYSSLNPDHTVLEAIAALMPGRSHAEVRRHLNDFLFRKNEEVNAGVGILSGGEKARLCLAQIAAATPKLLILDEITNNLDLETKEHVIQVINAFPGALIIVSHDADFLQAINATGGYRIQDGLIQVV